VNEYNDTHDVESILLFFAGESCAFVGGSGSGKSTILLLLQGMYKPTSGQILVDGVDIQAAGNESLSSYRSQIAIVDQVLERKLVNRVWVLTLESQEPKLFDRTIRENIAYSVQPELPPTDVRLTCSRFMLYGSLSFLKVIVRAAQLAKAHEFIMEQVNGYDTKVCENTWRVFFIKKKFLLFEPC
jgi:ATP-binding cassette subfamily B protein